MVVVVEPSALAVVWLVCRRPTRPTAVPAADPRPVSRRCQSFMMVVMAAIMHLLNGGLQFILADRAIAIAVELF